MNFAPNFLWIIVTMSIRIKWEQEGITNFWCFSETLNDWCSINKKTNVCLLNFFVWSFHTLLLNEDLNISFKFPCLCHQFDLYHKVDLFELYCNLRKTSRFIEVGIIPKYTSLSIFNWKTILHLKLMIHSFIYFISIMESHDLWCW